MEINKLPDNPSELKDLLKAREKYYYEAIKNNVKFDKNQSYRRKHKRIETAFINKEK